MLDRIKSEYELQGEACNLAQLVAETAKSQDIAAVSVERFQLTEQSMQDDFLAFVASRGIVASGNHPIMARSRRLVSHVNMYTPVLLATHEGARDLQGIPFVENPPIDTFSPEATFTTDEKPHFYGFAVSFLQPQRILKHAVIANPWLNVPSRRVGLIRRASPALYTDVSDKQLRYQKTFQQVFSEILAKAEHPSTDS